MLNSEAYVSVKRLIFRNDVNSKIDRIHYRSVFFKEDGKFIGIDRKLDRDLSEKEREELSRIPGLGEIERDYSGWRIRVVS